MTEQVLTLDHPCLAKELRDIQTEFRDTPLSTDARERLRALGGTGVAEVSGMCPEPNCNVRFATEGRRLYVHGDIGQIAAGPETVTFAPGMLRHGVVDPDMAYDPDTFFAAALRQDGVGYSPSPLPDIPTTSPR